MLRRLQLEQTSNENAKGSARIVIIPSLIYEEPSKWGDPPGAWLESLARALTPFPELWEFLQPSRETDLTAIQNFLHAGGRLLESIGNLYDVEEGSHKPLLFIAHGLGGFTLLKALCTARGRFFQYRNVVDVISGILFLSVPNVRKEPKRAQQILESMLKCRDKSLGKLPLPAADVKAISGLCEDFELIPLNVPVLYAFEKYPTPIQKPALMGIRRTSEVVIVTESVCGFNKQKETLLGADADHMSICKIQLRSKVFQHILRNFGSIAQEAPEQIAKKLEAYVVPSGLQKLSLRSETASKSAANNKLVRKIAQASDPSPAKGTDDIHQKNRDFFGREIFLNKLDDFLLPECSRIDSDKAEPRKFLRSFAICGLGGIRKTELAVHFAHTRREKFEAVFWVVADNENILAGSFARIAQQLGLEDKNDKDLAASREIVKGWLSSPVRHTPVRQDQANEVAWLLIFDNVEDMDVLSDYWPEHGHGSVLITSRDPLAKRNVYMAQDGVNLAPFSRLESMELMQRTSQVKAIGSDIEALSEISDRIQGFPLTIKHMAPIVRDSRMSYAEFLRFYDREGVQRFREIASKSVNPSDQRSLATVWALDKLSSGAKALLYVLSLLDPDNVPECIVTYDKNDLELPGYPTSLRDYYEARATLLRSSLITQSQNGQALSSHRLVQETTRALINADLINTVFRTAFVLVSSEWPLTRLELHHSTDRFEKCSILFPSLLRLKSELELLLDQKPELEVSHEIANLLNDSGWYLFERGSLGESKTFFRLALKICERLGVYQQHNETVQSMIRQSHWFLGCAEVETNNPKPALTQFLVWLELAQTRKDQNGNQIVDYELGCAHNEMGNAYASSYILDKAEEQFRLSITAIQGAKNYDETWLGWPEPNLAMVLWLTGRHEEARKLIEKSLASYAKVYGYDDTRTFKTGKMLYIFGNILESQKCYDESLDAHYRCLRQYRATLGNSSYRTGDVCYKLAGHYMRLRAYNHAEMFLSESLKIYGEKAYFKQQLARATFRYANLKKATSLADEASSAYGKATNLRKECLIYDRCMSDELSEADFDSLVFWQSR